MVLAWRCHADADAEFRPCKGDDGLLGLFTSRFHFGEQAEPKPPSRATGRAQNYWKRCAVGAVIDLDPSPNEINGPKPVIQNRDPPAEQAAFAKANSALSRARLGWYRNSSLAVEFEEPWTNRTKAYRRAFWKSSSSSRYLFPVFMRALSNVLHFLYSVPSGCFQAVKLWLFFFWVSLRLKRNCRILVNWNKCKKFKREQVHLLFQKAVWPRALWLLELKGQTHPWVCSTGVLFWEVLLFWSG